jgi:hypothetical protein
MNHSASVNSEANTSRRNDSLTSLVLCMITSSYAARSGKVHPAHISHYNTPEEMATEAQRKI